MGNDRTNGDYPAQRRPMRQQSTSAQSCTDSSSTYSQPPCSPRPRGPKTTPGIHAAANSAVSDQAAIPDNPTEPVTSRIALAVAAALGASGEISYGGREATVG